MTPEEIERQRRNRRIREQALINRAQSDRGWMGNSSPGGGIYALDPDTGGGVPIPPFGFALLRGADGKYLTGTDGKYLYGRAA